MSGGEGGGFFRHEEHEVHTILFMVKSDKIQHDNGPKNCHFWSLGTASSCERLHPGEFSGARSCFPEL
jgi:hypothetical protein